MRILFIGLFLFSTSLFAQGNEWGINVKLMSGKILLYRDGVHFEYDGSKKLKPGDVLQTQANSSIMIEFEHFHITLAPNTFFELKPGETRKHVTVGRLLFGSIHTYLKVIRTEKPYQIFGSNFISTANRSQAIYFVARNRRELKMMLKGNVSGAPDILSKVQEFQKSATVSSKIVAVEGPIEVELANKSNHKIDSQKYLEFRAEGMSAKIKDLEATELTDILKALKYKLPAL